MSEQEIKVPDLGGADEVEVIEILVSQGDSVEEEDPILTVESDKASVELPSPGAGKIIRITVKVGDKVKEGDVVGMMEASGEAGGSDDDKGAGEEAGSGKDEKADHKPEDKSAEQKPAPKKSGGSRKETVKVPSLDGFDNVPVIEINVSEGDEIEADDPLVTVESDKATMEIPSPYAGKIGKILVSEGDKISEGLDLVEMTVAEDGGEGAEASGEEDASSASATSSGDDKPESKAASEARSEKPTPEPSSATYEPPAPGTKVHAGPAVRKLAREFGADLARIKGSGPKNRILKDDVQAYVKSQLQQTDRKSVV